MGANMIHMQKIQFLILILLSLITPVNMSSGEPGEILRFQELPYNKAAKIVVSDANNIELGIILSQNEFTITILTKYSYIVVLDYAGNIQTQPVNGARLYPELDCKGGEFYAFNSTKHFYPKILIKNYEMKELHVPVLENSSIRIQRQNFKSGRVSSEISGKECRNYLPVSDLQYQSKPEAFNGFKIKKANLAEVGLPETIAKPLGYRFNP